jgi:predicted signal transduction protein with EAL and GGDEF domain
MQVLEPPKPSNVEILCALEDMLVEADAALYDAKHTGRNKVVCFGIENVENINLHLHIGDRRQIAA